MGWFKRLCLFVYGLAGLLALAALMLPWVGPYTTEATSLLTSNLDYWYAVLAVVAITGLGALICLLRSLFTPRNRKSVTVSKVDGGEITVTRTAIASQAKHIVESDGTCVAANTRVRARKHTVKVHMRVTPRHALNVVDKGAQLHDELVQGLQGVCGNTLKDVSLVFTDPQSFEDAKPDYLSTTYADLSVGDDAASTDVTTTYLPSNEDQAAQPASEANQGSLDGITVPLRAPHHEEEAAQDATIDSSDADASAPAEEPASSGSDAAEKDEPTKPAEDANEVSDTEPPIVRLDENSDEDATSAGEDA